MTLDGVRRHFIAGIRLGGISSGGPNTKTAAEQTLWGGTAGAPYDPCFRAPCDTYSNTSTRALELNADAVAYATLQFAMNTSEVNGERGNGNFRPPRPPPEPPTR